MTGSRARRILTVLAALVAVGTGIAAPAVAHVQVRPTVAAPGDAVLWTLLVPGEREVGTRSVELAIPDGVLPFSFEDPVGWERETTENADGTLRSIRWTGSASRDGLAVFRFLASTPDAPGEIAWKAIQRYADGEVVRWIGAPSSDTPASVTTVAADAPRENAGGEGPAADGEAGSVPPSPAATSTDDGRDGLTLALASAALVLGATALGAAVLRRRPA